MKHNGNPSVVITGLGALSARAYAQLSARRIFMRLNTSLETGGRWLRAVAQGSTLLSVMMIALVWLGVGFHLRVEHSDAEGAAVQNTANLARAFEEHLSRSLNEIDRSLKIIRSNTSSIPATLISGAG
jgi:hypothetical protein